MNYATAYQRWVAVGPYYAMFPISFADWVIDRFTEPGQWVLDPFAGRGSSIFSSAATGRFATGIEINPVGWLYAAVKLHPASAERVMKRIHEIAEVSREVDPHIEGEHSPFFELCFSDRTRQFLLTCRLLLDWRHSVVDRTLMALILVDLHGRRDKSFSNQMSQSKAMSPDYSVAWWSRHGLTPPDLDPETFLAKKIRWRYAKGVPGTTSSEMILGDSTQILRRMQPRSPLKVRPYSLLFTSPPYIGITDYHRDQWLRLWMLGGPASAARSSAKYRSNFESATAFRDMLLSVFVQAANLMDTRGHVYVRTDARPATFNVTRQVLAEAFPGWQEQVIDQPYKGQTQTARFGDFSPKPGERDIILTGPAARRSM